MRTDLTVLYYQTVFAYLFALNLASPLTGVFATTSLSPLSLATVEANHLPRKLTGEHALAEQSTQMKDDEGTLERETSSTSLVLHGPFSSSLNQQKEVKASQTSTTQQQSTATVPDPQQQDGVSTSRNDNMDQSPWLEVFITASLGRSTEDHSPPSEVPFARDFSYHRSRYSLRGSSPRTLSKQKELSMEGTWKDALRRNQEDDHIIKLFANEIEEDLAIQERHAMRAAKLLAFETRRFEIALKEGRKIMLEGERLGLGLPEPNIVGLRMKQLINKLYPKETQSMSEHLPSYLTEYSNHKERLATTTKPVSTVDRPSTNANSRLLFPVSSGTSEINPQETSATIPYEKKGTMVEVVLPSKTHENTAIELSKHPNNNNVSVHLHSHYVETPFGVQKKDRIYPTTYLEPIPEETEEGVDERREFEKNEQLSEPGQEDGQMAHSKAAARHKEKSLLSSFLLEDPREENEQVAWWLENHARPYYAPADHQEETTNSQAPADCLENRMTNPFTPIVLSSKRPRIARAKASDLGKSSHYSEGHTKPPLPRTAVVALLGSQRKRTRTSPLQSPHNNRKSEPYEERQRETIGLKQSPLVEREQKKKATASQKPFERMRLESSLPLSSTSSFSSEASVLLQTQGREGDEENNEDDWMEGIPQNYFEQPIEDDDEELAFRNDMISRGMVMRNVFYQTQGIDDVMSEESSDRDTEMTHGDEEQLEELFYQKHERDEEMSEGSSDRDIEMKQSDYKNVVNLFILPQGIDNEMSEESFGKDIDMKYRDKEDDDLSTVVSFEDWLSDIQSSEHLYPSLNSLSYSRAGGARMEEAQEEELTKTGAVVDQIETEGIAMERPRRKLRGD